MTSYEQVEVGCAGCLLSLGCGKQPFDPLKKGVHIFDIIPFGTKGTACNVKSFSYYHHP